MTKSLIVAALLSSIAVASFAQSAVAPAADKSASAPMKHKHVKKAKHAASAAVNPETSTDKKGDGK